MPDWGSSSVWLSLFTLTFLEIVLGVGYKTDLNKITAIMSR